MPLWIPDLDDRKFTDLVEEARSMISHYAPEWTNHNASDPGITLIELLAHVSETLIHRLNRVTRKSRIKFLQLLQQVETAERARLADPDTPLAEVDEALRQAVLGLRKMQRAVTTQDYEDLIKNLTTPSDLPKVIRSRCFSGKNLEISENEVLSRDCPGHVSVVIVPDDELDPDKLASLLQYIRNELEPMRLLTTRLHIVKPVFLWLSLRAVIKIQPGANFDRVRDAAIDKVKQYFNPLPDIEFNRVGWPFGRPVYISEVYDPLEEVAGVDDVLDVRALCLSEKGEEVDEELSTIGIQIGIPAASTVGITTRLGGDASGETGRLIRDVRGALFGVVLRPYELVKIVFRKDNLLSDDTCDLKTW